jgi:hypothetical protein
MGGIDFDPYSTKLNNTLVNARRFHDIHEVGMDGTLERDWGLHGEGRVMVFAPSGMDPNRRMLRKTLEEYRAGRIKQACFLVTGHETCTRVPWIWDFPICMPFRRLRLRWFDDELDQFKTFSPSHWSFIVYFPPCEAPHDFDNGLAAFHDSFSSIGRIVFNEFSGDLAWRERYRLYIGKEFK